MTASIPAIALALSLIIQAGAAETDQFGYPLASADPIKIRKLFEDGKFEELDKLLNSYQEDLKLDITREMFLDDAIDAFGTLDLPAEDAFGEWVDKSPNSPMPYLARASFYKSLGWKSRGLKWASKTSDEQFRGMRDYFRKAEKDLNAAIEKNSEIIVAYVMFMDIYGPLGEDISLEKSYSRGLRVCPHSFNLRRAYMHYSKPRWGGSYEKMEKLAGESEKLVGKNPRLKLLRGLIFTDRGDMLSRDDKNDESIANFNKAIEIGHYWGFFTARGHAYFRSKDYDMALTLRPRNAEILYWRGRAFYNIRRIDKSFSDLTQALRLDPAAKDIKEWHEFIVKTIKYYKEHPECCR